MNKPFNYKHIDTGFIYFKKKGFIMCRPSKGMPAKYSLLDTSDFNFLIKTKTLVRIYE